MAKRKHQIETEDSITKIIDGAPTKYILAKVTPGGGKSALPIIAGRLVTSGHADAICWIVPRKSLQHQAESNFQDPFFREMFDHTLSIRSSTNDKNPCRGLNGFVTTYQAIGMDDKKTVKAEFQRRRFVLVLDEFHHAELFGSWASTLDDLVAAAKYVVLMTGTLERNSGKPIAFLPYKKSGDRLSPNLSGSEEYRVIEYTRQDALAERAIIPLHFTLSDGSVKWTDAMGADLQFDSISEVPEKVAAPAVYTAISTDFARELLKRGLNHWQEHRRINTQAKLLIVTANISHARRAVKYLRDQFYNADIATSHESAKAAAAIRAFKSGKRDILVTIAMAYEGLDVPAISHIVSLTHIRSTPWIEQMLARAVRVAPGIKYERQYGYIFAPDDPLLRNIVSKIEAEQLPFLKKTKPGTQKGLFGDEIKEESETGNGELKNPYGIIPVGSSIAGQREVIVGNNGVNPTVSDFRVPSDIESDLREKIEKHVRKFAFDNRYQNQRINAEIKKALGKARSEMNIKELSRCLAHVRRVYPIGTSSPLAGSGYSRPRARRPRVPTKAYVYETNNRN